MLSGSGFLSFLHALTKITRAKLPPIAQPLKTIAPESSFKAILAKTSVRINIAQRSNQYFNGASGVIVL